MLLSVDKVKRMIKHLFPCSVRIYNLIPENMRHPIQSYKRRQHLSRMSSKQIFNEIYRCNAWEDSESLSGGGSNLINTEVIRSELPKLLFDLGARSLFDIPCGDFNWMKHVNIDSCTYIGADIVEDLIICNNEKFGGDTNGRRKFVLIDVTHDPLPTVDLILCRDCLVHFSFEDIFKALNNVKASNSKYLLTTTYTRRTSNKDILTGEWRPLNLQAAPFSFPPPIKIINENYNDGGSKYSDKSLGLWKIKDLVL